MMKRVLASVLLFLCCAVVSSVAATPFEGKVVYRMTVQNETIDMAIYVKEKKSKIALTTHGQTMNMVMDSQEQKMYMLMDEQKMAMSISLDAATSAAAHAHTKSDYAANPPKKTGKTKTIAGYTCEQWELRDKDGSVVELWSSSDVGSFTGFTNQGPMTGMTSFDFSGIKEFAEMQGMFPMAVIVKDDKGAEVLRMEATSVEKKTLSDAMFTVPTGYHIMEMPKGMDKMMKHGNDE